MVADGCFSKFRKELVSSPVSVSSQFIGLVMHNVPQYSPGHAELVLTSSGPILVYQISSTCTRILVDISSKPNTDLKEYIRTTVLPQLPSEYPTTLCSLAMNQPVLFIQAICRNSSVMRWRVVVSGLCRTASYHQHPSTDQVLEQNTEYCKV